MTQAYYDALLSDRLVAIAEATLDQAGATLQQTQAGFDAGTQPEFEVLRARVTRDSQTPLLIRQRVNREVALLRLKQLLDLPADSDLRLADDLGDARWRRRRCLPRGSCRSRRRCGPDPGGVSSLLPRRCRSATPWPKRRTVVSLREASLKAVRPSGCRP